MSEARASLLGTVVTAALRRPAAMHWAGIFAGSGFHADDRQAMITGAPDAGRILVLGSGVASGWGVQTHGLGLLGQLQRAMQFRLDQPFDVELVGGPHLSIADAGTALGDRAREHWDAVVVALGVNDAMRLVSPRAWIRDMGALLARLDADMPHGGLVPVLVLGIPPIDSIEGLRTSLSPVHRRHGRHLNELTEAIVARNRRATFLPLPAMTPVPGRPFGSPDTYAALARLVSHRLVAMLPEGVRRFGDELHGAALSPPVAAVLDPANARAAARVRTALQAAAAESGSYAALNLLDGDRLWTVVSSSTSTARSVPREATFCDTTLREGFLHVPEAATDARFRDLELSRRLGFTSYMGVAVELEGERVGTIGLFNGAVSGNVGSRLLGGLKEVVEQELAALGGTAAPQLPDSSPLVPAREAEDASGEEGPPSRFRLLLRRLRFRRDGAKLIATAESRLVPEGPAVRLPGLHPIRVLLVGGEYAIGYGAGTHDQALDGALARLLQTRTGRGVVVENRSRADIRLDQLAASMGPSGARGFDLVVWAPTFADAYRVPGPRRWFDGLGHLLDRVESTSDAKVVLLGIPSLIGSQPLAVLGRSRAATLNRRIAKLASWWDRAAFVEPPPIELRTVDRVDGPKVYHEVAISVLPSAVELLEETAPATGPAAAGPAEAMARSAVRHRRTEEPQHEVTAG